MHNTHRSNGTAGSVASAFVALDVETANEQRSSICSIGAVRFEGGREVERWYRLIDPRTEFNDYNVWIHKIQPEQVIGKPHFPQLFPELAELVDDGVVVHHAPFDKSAINQTAERWRLPSPRWQWEDTLPLARRAWPQLADHRLPTLCRHIGYRLEQHHRAIDDAAAAGQVYLAICEELQQLPHGDVQLALWSEFEQTLMGQQVVLAKETTLLRQHPSLRRRLVDQGAEVRGRLSARTTVFVISEEAAAATRKTKQHVSAEQRRAAGQRLLIVTETEFLNLLGKTALTPSRW